MPRRFIVPVTAEPQALDEILRWHGGIVDALREQLVSVRNAIRVGSAVDYFRRVKGKLRDTLSLAYRSWHKKLSDRKKDRPDFDKAGILEELKRAHVLNNDIIRQYRECLKARHWVAHGRYSARPLEVDRLDPMDVYGRGQALLQALPN